MSEDQRDLCANCDQFRELHYSTGGAWVRDRLGCSEYQGTYADDKRRAGKQEEIDEARTNIREAARLGRQV